mmetsp:Transcript_43852/g.105809  ORF Transcript_43852/g.105809 Transcript_43852/m.105809 type:complete len:112 (+) Transcript_43852:845-1180(+)
MWHDDISSLSTRTRTGCQSSSSLKKLSCGEQEMMMLSITPTTPQTTARRRIIARAIVTRNIVNANTMMIKTRYQVESRKQAKPNHNGSQQYFICIEATSRKEPAYFLHTSN